MPLLPALLRERPGVPGAVALAEAFGDRFSNQLCLFSKITA